MAGARWSINRHATAGFLFGLAMIIGLSIFSYWFRQILLQSNSFVMHAQQVVKEVRDLSLLIEAADSDELRFMITGDPLFRKSVEQYYARMPKEFSDIYDVTLNEPVQRKRLSELKELIQRKREFMSERMALVGQSVFGEESKAAGARQSEALFIQIRDRIKTIEDEELQRVESRTLVESEMASHSYWVMPLGGLAGIGVLLVAIWSFNRQTRQLLRAEEEIRSWSEHLDERVKERTEELRRALDELESFSYSVAHDLRAPVRAIGGYSQILAEELDEQIPPESQKLLDVVRKEATRMGHLIDDLLAFSRIGRQQMEWATVDMTALAKSVFDDLAKDVSNRKIDFQLHPLSPAFGDEVLLRQVWVNLISNAIKFTKHCEIARIEIVCESNGKEEVYCVKDNGDGFDMRYVGKLFNVFQRLHHEEEFAGTGVGLALAQRIIQRHGGKIRAEGKPGAGASFCLSLPTTTNNK